MKNRSQILFKTIDIFLTPLQNLQRYKNIVVERNIAQYGPHDRNNMDIYYRDCDKDVLKPVVVYFAGGGFVGGDKRFRSSTLKFFASNGYATLACNHRLAPYSPFPEPIADCYAAVNYLPQIAEKYNLDLSRVIVAGDSSGGYMSTYVLAATINADLRARLSLPDPIVKPFGFIGFCGVYDLFRMVSVKVPFGLARVTGDSFFGFKLKKDFSNFNDYQYADIISTVQFIDQNWVPSFICYSKLDLFCRSQGEIILSAFERHNVPHKMHFVTNFIENHDYQLFAFNPHSRPAFDACAEYLQQMKEHGSLQQ